ncbi:MAG: cytochrome C [Gemmatimonadetes bacterium]|nr:MAG: cytochrome C [Gemmatimonadota bacterium]HMC56221.1 cytochrome c [Gemmatimonadaceae bacterium]
MSRLPCIPIALTVLLLTACGTARRGEPLIGERRPPDAKLALGEQVFDRNCSQCHPGGESGLGPALNNKPLPRFAMKIQIRNGVGAMPRFSSNEITDEQISAVTAYLVWLRRQH